MRSAYGIDNKSLEAVPEEVLFSLVSGFNVYVLLPDQTEFAFGGRRQRLVKHVQTGDLYYAVPVPPWGNDGSRSSFGGWIPLKEVEERWVPLAKRPMPRSRFVWPIDVATNKGEWSYLVFPLDRDVARYQPLSNLLVNWTGGMPMAAFGEEAARQRALRLAVATSLISSWQFLNSTGILYFGFDPSRMYYDANGSVKFGFCLSTAYCGAGESGAIDPEKTVPIIMVGEHDLGLSLDYLDPRAYQLASADYKIGSTIELPAYTDLFARRAMLFRLLVGRLPYYGPIMLPETNGNPAEHRRWLRLYQRNPVFIFDPDDDSNRVGGENGFAGDEIFEENWLAIPEAIREDLRTYLEKPPLPLE